MSSIFLGKGIGRPEDGRWPAVEFGLILDWELSWLNC